MANNKPKALLYCRVSSDRQKNEGHGLESQEHRCRAYAQSKGYEIEAVFTDSFTGGGDFMKRAGIPELLAHLDKYPHRNYVIIFDDLKRLARDTIFYLKLRQEFKARGATVESPNFTFEDSDEAVFVETVLAGAAELERKQNRRQVVQKQKARLEKGYWPFYPPPGYIQVKTAEHGKLLTPNKKLAIVKDAFEGFVSGRFKDQVDVQKFLQENDFLNGNHIYLEAVKRLLRRVAYAGYIEYAPWEVTRRLGHHKAIIDLATYEKAQDKIDGRTRTFSRKDTNPIFPLRGHVLCMECKQPLTAALSTARNKTKIPYYRCNHTGCPLKNKAIRKADIEGRFEELLKTVRPKSQILDYTEALFLECWDKRMESLALATKKKESELLEVVEEKNNLIKRVSRASEAVAKEYENRIEALANKELHLKEEIANPLIRGVNFETALTTVNEYIGNPYEKWQSELLNDKRLVLKLVFTDKIAYDRQNGFETANYSLPIKAFELLATSKSQGVDMVKKYWNQLEDWIFESYGLISSHHNMALGP